MWFAVMCYALGYRLLGFGPPVCRNQLLGTLIDTAYDRLHWQKCILYVFSPVFSLCLFLCLVFPTSTAVICFERLITLY